MDSLLGISGENIRNILVSLPGIFLGAFSLYYAYQKTSSKVLVSYTTESDKTTEPRIATLELINEKNEPLSVFSAHAVINNDVAFELVSFETPRVLKPFESMLITTPKYSSALLGKERYTLKSMQSNSFDIYLLTHDKKIKCRIINPPTLKAFPEFKDLRQVVKTTRTFNGKVYNDNCIYAVTSRTGSEVKTSFIDRAGFISDDWSFKFSMVPERNMTSKAKVYEYLIGVGYGKHVDSFYVDDLDR